MRHLLSLAILSLLATSARALPPDTWLVVIGNNHGDADEIGLHYAEDDARAMMDVMHTLGGVRSDRIIFLAGEQAGTVRTALVSVRADIDTAKPAGASALVVYYSGHSDANALHLDGTRLPLRELVDTVKGSGARTRMVILDACRSGGASRVKGVRATQSFELDFVDEAAIEGLAVITSSTARESSLESDRLRGSFFTHFFVGGLRGAADRDANGRVTLAEVYDYAYQETVRASGRTETLQHPTFAVDMKGKGAVVLSRLDAERSRQGRLTLPDQSLYLVHEANDGRLVAEIKPPRANANVVVPARAYAVQQRLPREYREFDVELRPGKTVALAGLPYRSIRYDRLVRARGGEKLYVQGIHLSGGLHGSVVRGEGALPSLALGYGIDLPWLSIGLRARGARITNPEGLDGQRSELGLGLTIERFTDLRWLSVSFGLVAEGILLHQTFETTRNAPPSQGFGAAFGGLIGIERALVGGLSLRLEGGPTTVIAPITQVFAGTPVRDEISAALTWSSNLGVVWRL